MAEAERVGRYEILAPLRSGGMARIDLARLRGPYELCRHAVIKRPLVTGPASALAAELEPFRIEARLLASLHHPNVIGFLEAGTDARGVDYLALEYVHGASLRDLAPPRGATLGRAVSLAAALSIVTEVAAGLHHVHEQTDAQGAPLGVVHRDVSPSNILLGYDGGVRLIDFGVAKLTEGATASNSLRGKITYMAPEQCKGEPIDRRADIYALGVILYELVTGHRPFHAPDDVAALHKVIEGRVVAPRELVATIDPTLEAIILRAMAYAQDARYATADALMADLDAFARRHGISLDGGAIVDALEAYGVVDEPWRDAPPPQPAAPLDAILPRTEDRTAVATALPPARRRTLAVAVAAVALLVVGSVGFAVYRHDASTTTTTATTPAASGTPTATPTPRDPPATATHAASNAGERPEIVEPSPVPLPIDPPPAVVDDPPPRSAEAVKPTARRRDRAPRVPVTTPVVVVPTSPPADARPAADPREPRQWKPGMFLPGEGSGSRP